MSDPLPQPAARRGAGGRAGRSCGMKAGERRRGNGAAHSGWVRVSAATVPTPTFRLSGCCLELKWRERRCGMKGFLCPGSGGF